jgi:outer membrane protein assembly factor BamB
MLSSTRRKLLAASGGALAVSGIFGSSGTAAAGESDESNVESEDGWTSSRGTPGNNAYFPDRSGPEAPVAVDWERDRGGPIAVRDGTVYQTTDEQVHALDAEDGSILWESDAVGASGTPAIDAETLYVGGDSLTALDADDGSVRWQSDLEDGEITPPNVYDGDVYALSETALYAFDSDGSERWSFEAEEEFYTNGAPPVADGAVFACSESYVFARELEDGSERWTTEIPDEMERTVSHDPIIAAQGSVAVAMDDGEGPYPSDVVLYDTETGEEGERYDGNVPATITEDRVYTNPTYDAAGFDRETGEQVWDPDQPIKQAQQPVVAADGIYVGIDGSQEDFEEEDEHGLFVFDEDGSVEWSVIPDDENGVPRLDATLVEGTVYGRGSDRLLAIRSEAELEEREDADEEADDSEDDEEREDAEEGDEDEESESDEEDDSQGDDESGEAEEETDEEEEAEEEGTEDDASDDDSSTDDATDDDTTDDDDPDPEDDASDDDDPEPEDDDAEGTPGFTTGAGIAGGALGLEWLRRRATVDDDLEE